MLPLSVQAENRKEPFTIDMEKAAIYCFAEAERGKGGGLILRKPEEKIVFLTKFCYPFWLAPWNTLSLVFDGLRQSIYTATYKVTPDAKAFLENASRSAKSLETYMAFLSDNLNYFQVPSGERTVTIERLVSEAAFLNEFSEYISEAEKTSQHPLKLFC